MSEEEIQNMLVVNRSINDMEQNFRKKLEDLQQRINKALNYIYINYGLLDKYQIEILEDILKGDTND